MWDVVQIASSGVSMMAMAWDTLNLQSDKRQREKRQILEGSCIFMCDDMCACSCVCYNRDSGCSLCLCAATERESHVQTDGGKVIVFHPTSSLR